MGRPYSEDLRERNVGATARQAGRGAKLVYPPPYSPALNPIEQAFAKLKALLRQAAQRSVEALWQTIGRLLDRFTPDECRNYFENAGYASS